MPMFHMKQSINYYVFRAKKAISLYKISLKMSKLHYFSLNVAQKVLFFIVLIIIMGIISMIFIINISILRLNLYFCYQFYNKQRIFYCILL